MLYPQFVVVGCCFGVVVVCMCVLLLLLLRFGVFCCFLFSFLLLLFVSFFSLYVHTGSTGSP